VNSTLAYEIGAVFLFAAMLMFGSAHGFIPRSLRNIGAPIIIGVALVGFVIWRFGPDLYANARSTAAPWFATPEPATPAPASSEALPTPTAATDPVKSATAKAHVANQAHPAANGIVIRDVVPVPAEPARPIIAAPPIAETPAAGKVAEAAPEADATGSSPYDSGAKRAVKSIGHFLHIGGKKKEPDPQ
jgi:hypothetical protein